MDIEEYLCNLLRTNINAMGFHDSDRQNPPVITTSEWFITLIIMIIPLVNVIMLFVWAFGETNPNKANWAKASLVFTLIGIVIYIILFAIFGAVWLGALR